MRTLRPAMFVAALTAALAGVLPGTGAVPATAAVCPLPDRPALPPPGMEVTLQLSSTTVLPTEPLAMILTVRNAGVLPVVNHRNDGQMYDFWVEDPTGVRWLWSHDKGFTQALERDVFLPGEARTHRELWTHTRCGGIAPPVALPGRYVARALWKTSDLFLGSGGWWSNPVEFTILPG